METLPNELQSEIFAYLPFTDLQRVRLTCHDFAAKAAARLFQHVAVWIQMDSLEMLHQCSTNETIRHHVKSLRIDLHLLPITTPTEPENPDDWECLRHDRYCYPPIRANACEDEFKQAMRQQERLETTSYGVDLLAYAFRQLPNLKEIQISNEGKFPFGSDFYPTCSPTRDTQREEDCGRLQLQFLVRAAGAAATAVGEHSSSSYSLDKFVIWDGEANPSPYHKILDLSPEDLVFAQVAFRNVKHFTWHMSRTVFSEDPRTIAQFISTMPLLERFDLSQSRDRGGPFWPQALVTTLLQDIHWKHLHTIRFPNFSIKFADITSFATRHQASLRHLEFVDLFLRDMGLRGVLGRLRKTLLNLEGFVFRGEVATMRAETGLVRRYKLWDPEMEKPGYRVRGGLVAVGDGVGGGKWHRELMGEIGDFVTRRSDVYPWVKIREIREIVSQDDGVDSDGED